MKRSLRALVPRSLQKWLTGPKLEERVQARTAELAERCVKRAARYRDAEAQVSRPRCR